jgi:mevalonate kinase
MNTSETSMTFSSGAKLMITGEYLVLKGAWALAIPLKFRQILKISEHPGVPALVWKTYEKGQHWFDAVYSLNEMVIGNANDFPVALNLREILMAARQLNPSFLKKEVRYEAVAELDFRINWGLGSSSSLIANIAAWSGNDPFELNRIVSGGSGYDIAAAISDGPVMYRKTPSGQEFQRLTFYPGFHRNLYFAYLGKKRSSAMAVRKFNESAERDLSAEIKDIDRITKNLINTADFSEFKKLIKEHEKIISRVTCVPPLKEKQFNDFNGEIKSLGAWGGDFIMLATDMPADYVTSWLRGKEMDTWFSFADLVLKPVFKGGEQ